MRALVVGAGSLGTVYGAVLARAGVEVQLLARPAHAAAITAAGRVAVTGVQGDWTAPLTATDDPAAAAPAELVLLLCQMQDTEEALAALGHVREHVQLAVSFQNGAGKDEALAAWCGEERVIGGASMVGATLEAPGRVRLSSAGTTYVGERDGRQRRRTLELAGRLRAGGLECLVADDIASVEWAKLVNAAATMALSVLPRVPVHVAFGHPLMSRCYVELVREGAAVTEAAGVAVADWPGLGPVATFAAQPLAEAVALQRERGEALERAGGDRVTPSMLRSLQTGRPLEVEAIHGFLVREADRLQVQVPMLRLAHAMLAVASGHRDHENGRPPVTTPRQTLDAYFEHVNAERFDAVAELFADDGELHAPGTEPRRGRAALASYFAAALRPYPEHRDIPTRFIEAGSTWTVEIRFEGAHASGAPIGFEAVDVFDFAPDGRIAKLTSWYDSHAVRQQLRAARGAA